MDYGTMLQMIMGMVGQQQAGAMTQQQIDVLKGQIAQMAGIPLPNLPQITPEQLGQAAQSGVYADPALKQSEQDSLSEYGNIYGQGGLDFKAKADINSLLNQANSNAQSGAASIRQHLQGTGQLGSGADIAMQQGNAQSAAQRGNANAMSTAALAEQRKMDALANKTKLASSMRGEDVNEKNARAAAQDARDQWNAASRQNAQQYNAGLPQQNFNNAVTKTTGAFAPGTNLAAAYANEGNATRGMWGNLGAAAAYGAKGVGSGTSSGGSSAVNPDDPSSVYKGGTNYGTSDVTDWENPYGGY